MVPKLRFPEFRDAGEWEEKKLGHLAVLITDKAGTKSYVLMSVTAGLGLISQIEKFGREIAGESYKNYIVIKKGDFAYNKSSTKQHPEGQIAILENGELGAVPNSIFTCFRVNEEYVSPYFLKYPFANNIHGKWLRNFIAVGARANGALNVNSKDLLSLPIVFPSLCEQQKIASCFSSLDELITTQTQKLEALKAHKKGLMQHLFPAEGETVPKLRFTEFRNEGEWEEKQLGQIGEFIGGGTPSKAIDSYWIGTIPWVSSSDIFEDSIHQIKISRFITEEALKDSATKIVPENSILLVSRVGVGKLAISRQSVCTSQDFTNFTPYKDNLLFLAYYLKFKSKTLIEYSQGMAIKGFTKDDISKLNILIPLTGEQKKIADCLSSLDELITAQTLKLNALKEHKKGLMQQLFPNVEEENYE